MHLLSQVTALFPRQPQRRGRGEGRGVRENLHGLECLVRAPLGQHITSLAYDTCTWKTTPL